MISRACGNPANDTCQVSRSKDFCFWRRRLFKVFTIDGHGGHLCHVTWTIYINFHSPFPKKTPHQIFALIGQAVSEKKMFENNGYVHVYSPGAGEDSPPGVKSFSLTVLFSH